MIDANAMTANEDGTYTKVYEAVGPFEKAVSFKVTNGTDWIGTSDGKNVAIDVFAAGDITVKYDPKAKDDQVTVTGKGVKTVESTSPVETTVAEPATAELAATTTAAAATVAPVTEPAETAVAAVATEAPKAAAKAEDAQVGKLVVTAKSNITPTYTQSFDPTTGQVTVTYWIQMTEKYMINAQWTMSYDKDYLTIDNTKGVNTDSKGKKNLIFRVTEGAGTIVNTEVESMPKGGIKANASDLDGYDLNDEGDRVPFVSVTFNPTGKTGNTEVVLDVEIMNVKNDDDPKEDQTYNEPSIPEKVTVNFFIDTQAYQMVNGQFEVKFDQNVLSINKDNNVDSKGRPTVSPACSDNGTKPVVNFDNLSKEPSLPINFSDIDNGGIWLTNDDGPLAVVSVVFDVVGDGDTEVFLDTQVLTLNTKGQPVDPDTWFEANKNNANYEDVLAQFAANADMYFEVLPEGTPAPTEAPTTEAPTTVAPTTEAPTTEAPTTEAPTTEPKPAEDIFVIAGSSNFVENGWSPDPDTNRMTFDTADGLYKVTVPDVAAEEGALYQVKVVQFVGGDPANAVWHGMDGTDLNYDFMLTKDCDVTVTYNPQTGEQNDRS